ncbi:SMI1/KNR4 family protein [Streptomyces sp. NPDC048409]|uniref:SMI1/KNR4 family protein n=1 Tax=Streptomyces sp. NPDC048409 TaxID=3154723 RepID=UPI00341C1D31
MTENYVERVMEMLGEPSWRNRDREAWRALESELGTALPTDYKEIVDAYGPVKINGHLYLSHPATVRWNLGEDIRTTSRSWAEIEWDEDEPEGDPRISLDVPELVFDTPDVLIPIAATDRVEQIFNAPRGASGKGSIFIESGDYEFFEFSCSFAEWHPGPVVLQDLPMTPDERPEKRYGPSRGM